MLDTWEKRINRGGTGPVLMELLKEKSIKQEMTIMLFLTFTHNNKNPPQNPEWSLSKPLIWQWIASCLVQSEIIDCESWKKQMPNEGQWGDVCLPDTRKKMDAKTGVCLSHLQSICSFDHLGLISGAVQGHFQTPYFFKRSETPVFILQGKHSPQIK